MTIRRYFVAAFLGQLFGVLLCVAIAQIAESFYYPNDTIDKIWAGLDEHQRRFISDPLSCKVPEARSHLVFLCHSQWLLDHASFLLTAPPIIAVALRFILDSTGKKRMQADLTPIQMKFNSTTPVLLWLFIGFLPAMLNSVHGLCISVKGFSASLAWVLFNAGTMYLAFWPVTLLAVFVIGLGARSAPKKFEPFHLMALIPLGAVAFDLTLGACGRTWFGLAEHQSLASKMHIGTDLSLAAYAFLLCTVILTHFFKGYRVFFVTLFLGELWILMPAFFISNLAIQDPFLKLFEPQ